MEDRKVKSGFVTILGLPNAGKSTFLNAILKENLAITSRKPQTTRKNLKGIYNDADSQIVFVDTPGIHGVKNELDSYMSMSIKKSVEDIDVIIAIVDIMTYDKDDFTKMKEMLKASKAKKILVINKIDLLNDNEIKVLADIEFEKTFYVSALKKKNITDVITYIKSILPYSARFYDEEDLTDEPMKQIVADMVRGQCLYKLDKEIPHGVVVVVDSMRLSKSKCMNIDATIVCEKDTHKGIIIGKGGQMIKNIGTGARIAIEDFMKNKVNLKLNVIVKPNWRDERTLVANFGYDKNNI